MKRPAPEELSYPTSEKRAMVMDKVAAATEAAARLNQKLGGGPPPQNPIANPNGNPMQAARPTITETTEIPDRYVGLVIGKKGEQITSLQNESCCKVQISQAGTPERTVTLTGTPQQIEHAKHLITDIIDKAEKNGPVAPSMYPQSGELTTVQMYVPGMKAGLIIGKGGETIKSLQEENHVKMVLIQESNAPTPEDKVLRITGEQSFVEKARMAVLSLINTRDRPGGPPTGYQCEDSTQVAVPAEKAGLVIGKAGASIKEICGNSGAHVEISKDPPPSNAIKLFNVRGSRMAVDQAVRMICDRAGIPVSRTQAAAPGPWGQYGYQQADPWGATNGSAQGGAPAPSLNPCTGQLDYSAAWADYYRKHGMMEFADAIMKQSNTPQAQQPQQQMAPSQPAPVQSQVPMQGQQMQGQYDYNQWQQWQQYQAWQAYQQQPGAPGQAQAGAYPQQAQAMQPGGVPGRPHDQ